MMEGCQEGGLLAMGGFESEV